MKVQLVKLLPKCGTTAMRKIIAADPWGHGQSLGYLVSCNIETMRQGKLYTEPWFVVFCKKHHLAWFAVEDAIISALKPSRRKLR
jgi:hypothetical protein